MSRTFAEISAPWFRRTRMRIFPLVLKILWAAALLAGATTFAQSQAPAPAKSSHAPGALPLTKFYDTPNLLPAGKPGKLIRQRFRTPTAIARPHPLGLPIAQPQQLRRLLQPQAARLYPPHDLDTTQLFAAQSTSPQSECLLSKAL